MNCYFNPIVGGCIKTKLKKQVYNPILIEIFDILVLILDCIVLVFFFFLICALHTYMYVLLDE